MEAFLQTRRLPGPEQCLNLQRCFVKQEPDRLLAGGADYMPFSAKTLAGVDQPPEFPVSHPPFVISSITEEVHGAISAITIANMREIL
jgi:hypothetical protein